MITEVDVTNPKLELVPGMYATVDMATGSPQRYITLPQTAITYNPYGDLVYRIEQHGVDEKGKPKLIAEQRFITPGATRGDQVAIVEGVKAGETVVTAGQLKLRNGSPIVVNNSVQPSDNPNPQVPNS